MRTWDERSWQLVRLNTFADKFDVEVLKNSIIDEFFMGSKQLDGWSPETPVIAYIYENTTEPSSLRKLIVDWYVWQIDHDWYTDSGTRAALDMIPTFVTDLAIAMSRRVHNPSLKNPFNSDPSSYYEDHSTTSGD